MILRMADLPTKVLVVEGEGTGASALKELVNVRFKGQKRNSLLNDSLCYPNHDVVVSMFNFSVFRKRRRAFLKRPV
jgi:hypothetical protein